MKLENQTFECLYDQESGKIISDLEFHKCVFQSSALSISLTPELRSTVRNVKLSNCEQRGCNIHCAVMEDVFINNLKTNGLLQAWGAVFKHVTFTGKIGRVMFSQAVAPGRASLEQQSKFDEANSAFYRNVDWALDIREADFDECEIQSIPANLVLRDPGTQVVVKRSNAARGEWRNLDLSKTHWDVSLDLFLKRGDMDIVLVAPKRNRKYRDLLDGLKMLRDIGVAEPS